jgi:hypothetical protein
VCEQNVLAKKIVAHHFGDENVNTAPEVGLHVERVGMFGNDADPIGGSVARDDFLRRLCDRWIHLAGDHFGCPGARGHHRQETRATADFENARVGTNGAAQGGVIGCVGTSSLSNIFAIAANSASS